jgi:hypothetical protein
MTGILTILQTHVSLDDAGPHGAWSRFPFKFGRIIVVERIGSSPVEARSTIDD